MKGEGQTAKYSEASFTHVDQIVEKAEIDMFGVFQNDNQVVSDICFMGSLRNFNVPLVQDTWKFSNTDHLKLPVPE